MFDLSSLQAIFPYGAHIMRNVAPLCTCRNYFWATALKLCSRVDLEILRYLLVFIFSWNLKLFEIWAILWKVRKRHFRQLSICHWNNSLIGKTTTFLKFQLSTRLVKGGFSHPHFLNYAYTGKIKKSAFIGMIGLVKSFKTMLLNYKCE